MEIGFVLKKCLILISFTPLPFQTRAGFYRLTSKARDPIKPTDLFCSQNIAELCQPFKDSITGL